MRQPPRDGFSDPSRGGLYVGSDLFESKAPMRRRFFVFGGKAIPLYVASFARKGKCVHCFKLLSLS
jgi:hypothetical protein